MTPIEPRGKWMMVDGFNVVEGPDHRGYVQIFGWADEAPPDDQRCEIPIEDTNAALVFFPDNDQRVGMPVAVDETCEAFAHAGREWLLLVPAPHPVSDRKMPGT